MANADQQAELSKLLQTDTENKVQRVLKIFLDCNVNDWAKELKQQYFEKAMHHLNEVAVLNARKQPLKEIAYFLIQRDY